MAFAGSISGFTVYCHRLIRTKYARSALQFGIIARHPMDFAVQPDDFLHKTVLMDNHRMMKSRIGRKIKSRQGVFIAGDRMALSPIKRESRAMFDSQIMT
jgi:hypothetical protein